MNKILELGKINTLKIARDTDHGFFLEPSDTKVEIMDRSDTEHYEVLLPNAYITDDMNIDDEVEVFLYTDSEDRIVATTMHPKALKDEFAFVKVVDTAPFGAFVDIGLPKDLLVPNNRQKNKFHRGDKRIIRIIEDEDTARLIGVEKITSFLNKETKHFKQNDEVKILVIAKTPLGFKVIVNNAHEGLVYENEIFTKLFTGDLKKAFVKAVREDGKLDISLQPIGKEKNKDVSVAKIIKLLEKSDKFLPYNSKSDADSITKVFGLSKKNFKTTLQVMLKEELITSDEKGITLL